MSGPGVDHPGGQPASPVAHEGSANRVVDAELRLALARAVLGVTAEPDAVPEPVGAAVRAAAQLDLDVPLSSGIVGGPQVKKVLRDAVRWYLRYLTQQVAVLGDVTADAIEAMERRVAELEGRARLSAAGLDLELLLTEGPPLPAEVVAAAAGFLQEVPGRVLHLECGDGTAVRRLQEAGLDAYGVDPQLRRPSDGDPELWREAPLQHLTDVGHGALGGLLLSGVVDRLLAPQVVAVADHLARVLEPGGRVVLVTADRQAWHRQGVRADLADGRPRAPETWARLLEERGFAVLDVRRHADVHLLAARHEHR